VPITCGSGDIGQVSNFGFKPIQVQVFEKSDATEALTKTFLDRCTGFVNQRNREHLRVRNILPDRELKPVAGYEPRFRCYPIEMRDVEVDLTRSEVRELRKLFGSNTPADEDAVRAAFMLWYQQNRMKRHWVHPDGPGCC
jgi:hypothetical protein